MQYFRNYAAFFWLFACLLMLAGGSLHACEHGEETVCPDSTSKTHEHEPEEGDSESSTLQHCCHLHAQGPVLTISQPILKAPLQLTALLPIAGISTPEAPVTEIDYPPQLA